MKGRSTMYGIWRAVLGFLKDRAPMMLPVMYPAV